MLSILMLLFTSKLVQSFVASPTTRSRTCGCCLRSRGGLSSPGGTTGGGGAAPELLLLDPPTCTGLASESGAGAPCCPSSSSRGRRSAVGSSVADLLASLGILVFRFLVPVLR